MHPRNFSSHVTVRPPVRPHSTGTPTKDTKDTNFVSLEEKHEHFIAARLWENEKCERQQGENERQWQNKSEQEHGKQNLW